MENESLDSAAQPIPVAHTRHTELTLDQIGTMQMGLARLMREYGERFWSCYYAAKSGNWRLAIYMINNIQKLHEYGKQTRPKMAPWLDQFEQEHLIPLKNLLKKEDWALFEKAYHHAVEGANSLHDELGYPYIHWELPPHAPENLRMDPPSSIDSSQ